MSTLVLSRFLGEIYETLAVGFETGHVCGEGFLGEVGAAGVDADADCGGEVAGDLGLL